MFEIIWGTGNYSIRGQNDKPSIHATSDRTTSKSNCLHLRTTEKAQKEIYGAIKLKEGWE